MKARLPEKHLSVKEAREILGSYGKSEFYRKLELGEIRALYEIRGNRRHYLIPLSALIEFIERLRSNQDDLGASLGSRALHPNLHSSGAAPKSSAHEQRDRSHGAVSGAASVRPSARSKPVLGTHGLGAAPREKEDA